MAFFVFEMDFFGFSISVWVRTRVLKGWVWKPSFASECWEISSKLQVSLLRLVQNQRIKSTIAEKLEFGNPGFKTWDSKFRFNTDIENPRIDQMNFWFTLIGPVLLIKHNACKSMNKLSPICMIFRFLTKRLSPICTIIRTLTVCTAYSDFGQWFTLHL